MIINVKRPTSVYYYKVYLALAFNDETANFYTYIPYKFMVLSELTNYFHITDYDNISPSIIKKIIQDRSNKTILIK